MTTLTVTLDQTTTPWTLDVSEQQVDVNVFPSTIAWELTGTAATGAWSTDPHHPPFKWLRPQPPLGTFSNPGIDGAELSATDNGPAGGPWPYQLCIKLDDNYYQTSNAPRSAAKLGRAPQIKNN